MATNIQPVKTPLSVQRKLSLAVGLLSFMAFIIQGLSTTWGFAGVGQQLTETVLVFVGAINIFFLGDTSRKVTEENKDEKDN